MNIKNDQNILDKHSLNRNSVHRFFLIVLSILIFTLIQNNAHVSDRVALLIANEDYVLNILRNPIKDAELIKKKLDELDYDVTVIRNADRYEMLSAIETFGRKSQSADSAVFYYSGHGMQDDYKQNYLLPIDSKITSESSIRAYGVEAYEVINALKQAEPRISLVIFDACRDNPFSGVRGNRNFSVEGYETNSELLVAYATQTGQYAQDGVGDNSPYAIALAGQLENAHNTPLLSMFDNIKNEVKQRTNNEQSPTKMGDAEVDTFLIDTHTQYIPVPSPLQAIEPSINKTAILDIADNHNSYKVSFKYPASWSETFSITQRLDPNYSRIFDMSSLDSQGVYFSEDKMRLTDSISDTKFFRTEVLAELYDKNPKDDIEFIPNSGDPYSFSSKQKAKQFVPLQRIYQNESIPNDVALTIAGTEPTGEVFSSNEYTTMWGNIDGYTDFFKLDYISSKDNLLRGLCSFILQGQDYDFNLSYSCLLYNKDSNLVVRISTPLSNATKNSELSKETIFDNTDSERAVQEAIRTAKIDIMNDEIHDETKNVVENIRSVAESLTVF